MITHKYLKRTVTDAVYNSEEKSFTFIVEFRTVLYTYLVKLADMSEEDVESIKRFKDGTHDLILYLLNDDYIKLNTKKRIYIKSNAIDKFVDRDYDPIELINYAHYNVFTQLDGMTTIVGMSGAGKTYSALKMLPLYANHFTKIAYLNYELTNRDIIERFDDMYPMGYSRDKVVEKLWMKDGIMTSLDLDEILEAMDVMPHDKVVFIVDNVGSVIGQDENIYHKQNEFLKYLDVICKERGYHALALTQTVKDHNMSLFDDNGEIKGSVNMSIMSGSIMLGNLSRSVLFTGFNGDTKEFKTKVLKRGTGINYHELKNRRDVVNEIITR